MQECSLDSKLFYSTEEPTNVGLNYQVLLIGCGRPHQRKRKTFLCPYTKEKRKAGKWTVTIGNQKGGWPLDEAAVAASPIAYPPGVWH